MMKSVNEFEKVAMKVSTVSIVGNVLQIGRAHV